MKVETANGHNIYVDTCLKCGVKIWWQDCPTGGWWIHDQHPSDHHGAVASYQPPEEMDDYGEYVTSVPSGPDDSPAHAYGLT